MTSNLQCHKGSDLADLFLFIFIVKSKENNLTITYASLILCSSHKLTPLLFSYGLLRRKFTLSLLLPKNFTSHFPKLKPGIGSGSDMPDSLFFWEIMEFSFLYWRGESSDGPGSKQQSRFYPFHARNIRRSKWSSDLGKRKGEVSHLYLK